MNTLLLTSVQGCGKTSVAKRLQEEHGILVGELSTLMFDRLRETHHLNNRDQIIELPRAVLDSVSNQAFQAFLDTPSSMPKILITHTAPRRQDEAYYPQDYSHFSGIVGIVMLVAAPAQIISRRINDKSRNRAAADAARIEIDQVCYLTASCLQAQKLNVSFWIVVNCEGRVENTAQMVADLAYRA